MKQWVQSLGRRLPGTGYAYGVAACDAAGHVDDINRIPEENEQNNRLSKPLRLADDGKP